MVRLRLKLLNAVSRSRGAPRPNSILPACPPARHIGHATLIAGLVGEVPILPVSPFAAILESASDDDVDLSQAKSALRVLAALGDGLTGVPWLKGTAGLGLEIVNALDNVQSNKRDCRDLALRVCQFLIIVHQKSRTGSNENSNIANFRGDLHRVLRTVKTISRYKFYRRVLKADDFKQQLMKCNKMLSHSRDIFLVGVHAELVAPPLIETATAKTKPNYRYRFNETPVLVTVRPPVNRSH